MSSALHPSLPSSGFYTFSPATLPVNGNSQTNLSKSNRYPETFTFEHEKLGENSPIQIWDVARNELVLSHPTAHPIPGVRTPQLEICFDTINKVDTFFKNCYRIWPLKNNRHLLKVYLNETSILPNGAQWNPLADSVLVGRTTPEYYAPVATIPDIIAHEFGHGFIYYYSPLISIHQGGAGSVTLFL